MDDAVRITATAPSSVEPSLDYSIFHAVNGLAGQNRIVDDIMIGIAKYSPVILALVLLALWLTWNYGNQRGALLAAVSSFVALGLGQLMGIAYPRDRPYLTYKVTQLITHSPDTSFPSDHTTLAFAVAVIAWQVDRRLGAALILFGLAIAFARVYVGAHYPSDVVGGALLGTVTSLVIGVASRRPKIDRAIDRIFALFAHWHLAARRLPAIPGTPL